MTDPERDFTPARREWMEWPDDIRQTAAAVIATTRCAWAVQCVADEPTADRARFADPLFRPALIGGLRACGKNMRKDIHRIRG